MRGDEVASSIDVHVREAIERMVGEIRSSVEDVREFVDQQLKAALQSAQADVNSLSFLPHIQKTIAELEESFSAERPAVSGGADATRVKQAIQHVEKGKSQVDVLNALLEQAVEFGSRAALLILRGETFSGWKGMGFSAHGGNDEMVKRFNAAPSLIPELDRVLRDEQVVIWDGANLSTRLGVSASARAILIPMVIKDKVSAAVYVDAVEADIAKLDAASLEILVFTTGLLIDTLAIRKKIPSPSLTEEGEAAPATSRPPAASAPAARPAAASPQSEATVAISSAQMREMMTPPPARPGFNVPGPNEFGAPAAAPAPRAPSLAPTATPAPETARATPPPPPAPSPTEDRPSTQYVPPSGIRGGASRADQPEDSKKHDEARRFARLLVSEIKLYNETKVDAGRKGKNLYERLKEDIDRSRQMYDDRIAEDVRKSSNYFYDELVRILADGNAETLGL
ncbi:MAG: hypothetical protein ABIP63_00825 [Thermoanaerobaculia bacterium]